VGDELRTTIWGWNIPLSLGKLGRLLLLTKKLSLL